MTSFSIHLAETVQENVERLKPQVKNLPFQTIPPTTSQLEQAIHFLRVRTPTVQSIPYKSGTLDLLCVQKGEWNSTDFIVDCFNGLARLSARKAFDQQSCLDWWNRDFTQNFTLLKRAVKDALDPRRLSVKRIFWKQCGLVGHARIHTISSHTGT